jgi:hypothetical protein
MDRVSMVSDNACGLADRQQSLGRDRPRKFIQFQVPDVEIALMIEPRAGKSRSNELLLRGGDDRSTGRVILTALRLVGLSDTMVGRGE